MIKLTDAYFGIMLPNFNRGGKLEPANLFDSMRVLRSVALYRTKPEIAKTPDRDLLFWCFGDTWGRCEYEWVVSPWAGDGEEEKVCVYEMYVKPNAELLMKIVDNISAGSCREWLKGHKS